MTTKPIIKCAIYTRKSSEEGLEQEFNSLDAQRAAGEAYIQSQKHEGWRVMPETYDDGGFSGGNTKRPGLQKLIDDIKKKKIDTVVVYKVDRLSRSLHDFAKLVDLFDQYKVTFVSVTQAFNTTNSMGRLTLNILLSFAQFEREVTGERIRDKFAASKKKGMWMGGSLPLGYDLKSRKLIVNEQEKRQVEYIFKTYIECGAIESTKLHLNKNGYTQKCWKTASGRMRGGKLFTKHSIKTILSNVLYIGNVAHDKKVYDGEQNAIVDMKLWDDVQSKLKENTVNIGGVKNQTYTMLLKGKIFDVAGDLYTSTYTKKGSKRYYYYLNKIEKSRISVAELDNTITHAISNVDLNNISLEIDGLSRQEIAYNYHDNIYIIAKNSLEKVVIKDGNISVLINKNKLRNILKISNKTTVLHKNKNSINCVEIIDNEELFEIILNVSFKSYAGKKMAYTMSGESISTNETPQGQMMICALGKSYKWNQMLEQYSIADIAKQEKADRTYVGDILKLKYLSPEITTMILNGTQASHLNLRLLMQNNMPHEWVKQKAFFS